METSFRYKMEHLGDYFVGMLDKVSDAAKCSAKGVMLTYDIHFLKKKKTGLINELGQRVAELRKSDPDMNISRDERIQEILAGLDDAEKKHEECLGERQSRLYPETCTCSGTPVEEAHAHEGHTHEGEHHAHEESHAHAHEGHTHEDEHHAHEDEHHTHEESHAHAHEDEHHTHEESHAHAHEDEHHTHEEHPHEEEHSHDEQHEGHTHGEGEEHTHEENPEGGSAPAY